MKKIRIGGGEATYVAMEERKRGSVSLEPADGETVSASSEPDLPVPSERGNRPPRVRRPDRDSDRCLAPTPDLEGHRARLREAFGRT